MKKVVVLLLMIVAGVPAQILGGKAQESLQGAEAG